MIRKQMPASVVGENGTYTWRITTRTPDRFGDVVEPSGIRWEGYLHNPVVLWAHSHTLPPIGRTLHLQREDDGLLATMEFAGTEFAQEVRHLVDAGFLRAASIGFVPKRWAPLEGGGTLFQESELVEWSVVPVPANPEALIQQAEAAGIVCKALRQLVGRQEEDWRVGGARGLDLLDDDDWDADAAEAQVRRLAGGDPDAEEFDWGLYRKAHVVYNAADPRKLGSYKLLFCKVRDGELVASRRGLIAVRVVLSGGRGGVDLPDRVIREAQEFVDSYLGPREESRAGAVLSRVNREHLESARGHLASALEHVDAVLANATPQPEAPDGPTEGLDDAVTLRSTAAGSGEAHNTGKRGESKMSENVIRPEGLEVITRSQASREEDRMEPGIRATRAVKAAWLAYRTPGLSLQQAARVMYPRDEVLQRALNETTASAGGVLVPEEFSRELIEYLYDRTVVRRAGARRLAMGSDTLHLGRATGGATAGYIAEGADIPKSQQTFDEIVLTAKRLTALVPVSNDLLRDASIDADRFVRDDLVAALAAREDLAFIRDDGTVNKPKGIRYWADPANVFAANATVNVDNIVADLYKAVRFVLEGLKGNLQRPGWIFATRTFVALSKLRDQGNWVFPELLQGRLLGYPVFVTDQIPTNLGAGADESEVYFVDFAECVIGERQEIEIVASGEASYVEGGQVVSAFSRNETVIRAVARHDFALRRPRAASVITGVKWQ